MAQTLESYPEEALAELYVEETDERVLSQTVLNAAVQNLSESSGSPLLQHFDWLSFARRALILLLLLVAVILLRRGCQRLRRRKRQ